MCVTLSVCYGQRVEALCNKHSGLWFTSVCISTHPQTTVSTQTLKYSPVSKGLLVSLDIPPGLPDPVQLVSQGYLVSYVDFTGNSQMIH